MKNIPYLEMHELVTGEVKWAANPSKAVRNALLVKHETYTDKKEAAKRCLAWEEAFLDYKRCIDRQQHISENSVNGLVAAYKDTTNWNRLSVNSKNTYQQLIDYVVNTRIGRSNITFGQTMHHNITVKVAEALHKQLCQDVSEHRANHVCKVLRRVWFVGFRLGLTRSNPFSKMGLATLPSRDVRWEKEHIDIFVKKADEMEMWSIGTLALMCYDLCQRIGDMRQMRWGQYDLQGDGFFDFVQEKSRTVRKPQGNLVSVPVMNEELKARLDSLTRGGKDDFIILNERTGRPYTRWAYKTVAEVREAAGLPKELKISDLRRTGATEAGEAGLTEDEIMALTGHTSREVVSVYVKKTRRMASTAARKRHGK
jgi:integrase